MVDVENVIKGLECCIKRNPEDNPRCGECPYDSACLNRLKNDALTLLKMPQPIDHDAGEIIDDLQQQIDWINDNEAHQFPGWGHTVLAMNRARRKLMVQAPVVPLVVNGEYECGSCRYELRADADSYCPCCGRKVAWDD